MLECFEDICDDSGGGYPWVTVFKEKKKSHEAFKPIDVDTIIVFCILQEHGYTDSSYLGHLLVPKTMPCGELLTTMVEEMASLQDSEDYRAFLVGHTFSIRDITCELSSLDEVRDFEC